MRALIYLGPGDKVSEERAKPDISATTDAIVKIAQTTICGTDLHILKGDAASCQPGRILGHEGTGVVDSVGPAVTAFKAGDSTPMLLDMIRSGEIDPRPLISLRFKLDHILMRTRLFHTLPIRMRSRSSSMLDANAECAARSRLQR